MIFIGRPPTNIAVAGLCWIGKDASGAWRTGLCTVFALFDLRQPLPAPRELPAWFLTGGTEADGPL